MLIGLSLNGPLLLATGIGVIIASMAIGLGVLTRSAFAG
jgi:hypothetical protein